MTKVCRLFELLKIAEQKSVIHKNKLSEDINLLTKRLNAGSVPERREFIKTYVECKNDLTIFTSEDVMKTPNIAQLIESLDDSTVNTIFSKIYCQ